MSIDKLKAYREVLTDIALLAFDDDEELEKIETKISVVDGKIEELETLAMVA